MSGLTRTNPPENTIFAAASAYDLNSNKTMFRLLAIVLITFFAQRTIAQQYPNLISPTKVTTIGYWNNGQSAKYHVSETSATYKGDSDKPFKEAKSGYDIRLKVTDSTATSYDFALTYTDYELDEETMGFLKELAELNKGLTIRYRTDELGSFDTILNLEELQKDLIEKLNLSKKLIAESQNEDEREMAEIYGMVIDNMITQFGDRLNVEALFLTDIVMLHGFYGFELQQGKPQDIELQYVTLGDFVLTGTGRLTLSTINKAKDECFFSTTEKPNRDEMLGYVESLALLFMMDSKKKFSMEELSMSMNTKKKMKMELSTGWMNSVETVSTVKMTNKKGEQRKVNTKKYERK